MFRTKVRHILTSYTRIDFAVIPEKGAESPSPYILVNNDGDPVKPETVREYLLGILMRQKKESSDFTPGESVERIRMLPDNLNIVYTETGTNAKVRQINLVAYSTSEEIELPSIAVRNLN